MNNKKSILCLVLIGFLTANTAAMAQCLPKKEKTLEAMMLANDYFMKLWPDPAAVIVNDKTRTSNLWTRGVYYEGLMDLMKINNAASYLSYSLRWAEGNKWSLRFGTNSRHADPMCAGQTYLDLYDLNPVPGHIAAIKTAVDGIVYSEKSDDWTWVDAIQMAMPAFAKLGVLEKNPKYWDRMFDLYLHTKNIEGGGLYNTKEHLWWRDKDFVPPYTTPNGKNCYWSRGNGWVIAALVRTMDLLPEDSPYYAEFMKTYLEMMDALLPLQRKDGFWNVSLTDPKDYGGPELSGTALFVYGYAWGINKGIFTDKKYKKAAVKGWNAMTKKCLRPDGSLGYVQSTGKEPKDGQPLSYDKMPNFQDYGLGCYLLAGKQIYDMGK